MQTNKLNLYLQKIIGLIFVVMSICMVACAIYKYNLYEKSALLKISLLCIVLFICNLIIISKYLSSGNWIYNAINIFVVSLSIHLFIVLFIGQSTEQISDFALALETSEKSFPLEEPLISYQVYSNWGIYPLYLKLVQLIFGSGAFYALIANAITYALSSSLIYVLCHLWLGKERIGYTAALLYTFWPSHSLYAIVLTPEFPNILLTLVSLVLIKIAIDRRSRNSCYLFAGLSAITLSLSGFFKSIDKIIIIDICITLILYLISKIGNYKSDKNLLRLKKFKIAILFLAIYITANKLTYIGLDYAYGTTVNRNPSIRFIYIGLNPYTYGTWNEKIDNVYFNNIVVSNYDFDKASRLTMASLLDEIKTNKHLTPTYFSHKFVTAWSDNSEIYWADCSLAEDHPLMKKTIWLNTGYMFTQCFWILICLFVCIDSIYIFIKPDYPHLFLCMLILGFAMLMLLIEVQARYKCVLYPYISILAADGLHQITSTIKERVFKIICYSKYKFKSKRTF